MLGCLSQRSLSQRQVWEGHWAFSGSREGIKVQNKRLFYLVFVLQCIQRVNVQKCVYNRLPRYACQFIEMCLMVTADHGPAVSGAHNTIVCARAGKDLISSLTSGLLTIVRPVTTMPSLQFFRSYVCYIGIVPVCLGRPVRRSSGRCR